MDLRNEHLVLCTATWQFPWTSSATGLHRHPRRGTLIVCASGAQRRRNCVLGAARCSFRKSLASENRGRAWEKCRLSREFGHSCRFCELRTKFRNEHLARVYKLSRDVFLTAVSSSGCAQATVTLKCVPPAVEGPGSKADGLAIRSFGSRLSADEAYAGLACVDTR